MTDQEYRMLEKLKRKFFYAAHVKKEMSEEEVSSMNELHKKYMQKLGLEKRKKRIREIVENSSFTEEELQYWSNAELARFAEKLMREE